MAITLVEEDGTGLSTANVYDSTSDCETWLTDRGYAVFAAGSSAEKTRWLLEATEIMERECALFRTGWPTGGEDQAMIWPRYGAVDRRFRAYDSDERPAVYREGIFLLAEEVAVADADSARITDPDGLANVRSWRVEGVSQSLSGDTTIAQKYPAAFAKSREAFPAGLRARRA